MKEQSKEEKKEIPAGLKQYVFAMYIGQKVYTHKDWQCFNDKSLNIVDPVYLQAGSSRLNHGWLVLRPLSSITDSEAIEVMSLQGYKSNGEKLEFITDADVLMVRYYKGGGGDTINHTSYQYLQQQGFALPIYYNGQLYSVVDLTQMQILQLQ